jgi:hypothetical protein
MAQGHPTGPAHSVHALAHMRFAGLLDVAVAIGAAISVALLGVMLASPWLPRAADVAPSATASASEAPATEAAPMGLYRLRGSTGFGPCLALELGAESYPSGDGEGHATALWWERGMTGCDARSTEVVPVAASVARVVADDDDRLIGYAVRFALPAGAGDVSVEITILAAQSTQQLIQALETSTPGSAGLVFDEVQVVDPRFDPLPSATPVAFQPRGLYLLEGPLDSEGGTCLVLELGPSSFAVVPDTEGAARVRWWERAAADPENPAECLTRKGEVTEADATVLAVPDAGEGSVSYTVSFAIPVADGDIPRPVEIAINVEESTTDQLRGRLVVPAGGRDLVFDRVDSIDPPLGP